MAATAKTRYDRIAHQLSEGPMFALVDTIIALSFAFLVIFGALSDLSSFRIPNGVSYGLVLLFGLQSFVKWLATPSLPTLELPGLNMQSMELTGTGFHVPALAVNLAIGFFVLIVSIIFWRRGYIGGGDAKYLAAASLWMGPVGVVEFMVLLSALALIMALVLKISSMWGFLVHAGRLPVFIKRLYAKFEQNQLPYGFPIGIAALLMIPEIFKV